MPGDSRTIMPAGENLANPVGVSGRLLAGVAAAVLTLSSCTSEQPDQPAPNATASPSATPHPEAAFAEHALALADPSVIGMSPADLEKRFKLIDYTEAPGIRTDLSQRTVQPKEGQPNDWSKFDPIAKIAKEHGKQVDAILDYAPPWAGMPGCDEVKIRCAPRDPAEFKDFAVAAVTRYAPQDIHTYEIWNEPNKAERWSLAPDAAAFARLVREVCQPIKQADPKAFVVIGGLALGDGPKDIPMAKFLREFYDANPGDCYDAVGVHFYNPNASTWTLLSEVHQVMVDHKDNRRIWGTEVGVETSGACGVKENTLEARQAAQLPEIVKTWRSYPWTGPIFWFGPQDVSAYGNHWGLTCDNPAGTPKPALAEFKNLAGPG